MPATDHDSAFPALPLLHLWRDGEFRTAAENMALDEALFDWTVETGLAAVRFYVWDHPAKTIGYFTRNREAPDGDPGILPVRRFTGGGLVEHGEDLTFALTVAAGSEAATATAVARYRWIHAALAEALRGAGIAVAAVAPNFDGETGPCFANPVPWDLVDPESGRKIAGGAQRRSRGAFIHQGSVRLPGSLRSPASPWIESFLAPLSPAVVSLASETRERLLRESERIVASRYGDPAWNGGTAPNR